MSRDPLEAILAQFELLTETYAAAEARASANRIVTGILLAQRASAMPDPEHALEYMLGWAETRLSAQASVSPGHAKVAADGAQSLDGIRDAAEAMLRDIMRARPAAGDDEGSPPPP